MVRALVLLSCASLTSAFRTHQDSFPTDVWEEVTQVTCDQLEDRAKERMGHYRGGCGVDAADMDSGAAGFALLRSGADKLCKCKAVDVKQLRQDRADIEEQGCSGGIFGPIAELDRIYDECKSGNLDMSQFGDGDDKLVEEEEEAEEEEEEEEEEPPAKGESRTPYQFSGPIRFTHVGGTTGLGDSTEYCLSVKDDAVTTAGTEVYGKACEAGNNAQVWYYDIDEQYQPDGNGQLRVGPELLCLEQKDEVLILADCAATNAQGWKWMNGDGQSRMVQNKKSHHCAGLRYSTDSADGKAVTTWGCKKSNRNQAANLCTKESKEGCAGYVW